MKLLKQEHEQCLLYSAAMLLDVDPDELIQEIGHDGLDIWWPNFEEPRNLRSHHIQEIIDCFWRRGYGLISIAGCPVSSPDGSEQHAKDIFSEKERDDRFTYYLEQGDGILILSLYDNKGRHAVAWNHKEELCYDPNGKIYSIHNTMISELWLKIKIEGAEVII